MNYRKLWLENGTGEKYDLTNIADTLLMNSLGGLGANATLASQRVGTSQLITFSQWQLLSITGNLIFKNENTNATAYDEYKKFFDFTTVPPLVLNYQTPDLINEYWYREVTLSLLEKSEVDVEYSTLICGVEFVPMTMWLSSEEYTVVAVSGTSEGKSYPLTRPYAYAINDIENIRLFNKYNTNVPIIIEIKGDCIDPNYSLFDFKNEKYGAGKIFGTYDYVYINSSDLEEQIFLSKNDIPTTNPVSKQDPTVGVPGKVYVTFLYLRPGENFMKFNFGNVFNGEVVIRWRGLNVTV